MFSMLQSAYITMPPSQETQSMPPVAKSPYFTFSVDRDFTFSFKFSLLAILIIVGLVLGIRWVLKLLGKYTGSDFEIDEAEMGLGQHKLKFKPNREDRQIAYKIWVELSTRKIGLPIDLTNDVISEIYDSWYNFFSITRELIKDIPVSKLKQPSTTKIIDLSVSVLNEGLRPHLTQWQARFRHWYDAQLKDAKGDIDPQSIQTKYTHFAELEKDLTVVNNRLMNYRESMKRLILQQSKSKKVKEIPAKPSLSEES